MKLALFFICVLFILFEHVLKSQTLSENSEISIITLGPYQGELYSAFGHSAFRVFDPANNWDIIYNYGAFSFNQPNFYLNFALGKPFYKLRLERFDSFQNYAIQENRRIVQQILNLEKEDKQILFDFLQWNAEPENSSYYYNYIYDNCATKIRDVLDSVFKDRIYFNYSFVKEDLTFRQLMDLYLQEQPWGNLGIDLCLGTGIDKIASGYHYMFIPDYIEIAMGGAKIDIGSKERELISDTVILNNHNPEPSSAGLITPQIVFIIILLIVIMISIMDIKRKKLTPMVDTILFSIVGIVGWFLLFLWLFTEHISENNYNLIWALSIHFPIALILLKKPGTKFQNIYFLSTAIILCLLLILWNLVSQNMHESLIPIILTLLVRSIVIIVIRREGYKILK